MYSVSAEVLPPYDLNVIGGGTGYAAVNTVPTGDISIRERRRLFGLCRVTEDDIEEGRRFPDGVCTVEAKADVRRMHKNDTVDTGREQLLFP